MRSLCRLVCVSLVLAGLSACGRGGAASWQGVPLGTQASFRSTWFVDAQHGFIGGGSFSVPGGLLGRTADGGKTWRFTSGLTTTAPDRRGIDLTALHFFDPLRGLAATGDGRILATDDGGDTWATVWEGRGGIDPIFDLSLVGDHDGWAAGVSGIVRTRDGGRTWLRLPIEPSQLVEPARAIHMVDREHGWLVGRRATLLATTDGGLTWRSIRVPLPASDDPVDFHDVSFVDDLNGWVVGDQGTLLSTRDGGATWSLIDTGVADARSAPKIERIPRNGRVDLIDAGDRTPGLTLGSISFVDRARGWLVGRYAAHGRSLILGTEDGGATWTVEATIRGEDLPALTHSDGALWAVGEHVGDGPQMIYWRRVGG